MTRGVEPDTLVVTRGNAKLRDGMAVRTNVAAEQNG